MKQKTFIKIFLGIHISFFLLYASYLFLKKDIHWVDLTLGMAFTASMVGIIHNIGKLNDNSNT